MVSFKKYIIPSIYKSLDIASIPQPNKIFWSKLDKICNADIYLKIIGRFVKEIMKEIISMINIILLNNNIIISSL